MLMMFQVLGLSGLEQLKLHLRMLLDSVPFLLEVWFLAEVSLCFVLYGLAVIGFGKLGLMFDAADVFLCRDSSIAPLLDMKRRFKAVVGTMVRSGISLSRSVELTVQWDRILALGPLYPVTLDDLGHWCILSCRF